MPEKQIDNQLLKQVGEQHILDEKGEKIRLADLWQEQRSVMVFIRHFG